MTHVANRFTIMGTAAVLLVITLNRNDALAARG